MEGLVVEPARMPGPVPGAILDPGSLYFGAIERALRQRGWPVARLEPGRAGGARGAGVILVGEWVYGGLDGRARAALVAGSGRRSLVVVREGPMAGHGATLAACL